MEAEESQETDLKVEGDEETIRTVAPAEQGIIDEGEEVMVAEGEVGHGVQT